jgi:hypothetical protein
LVRFKIFFVRGAPAVETCKAYIWLTKRIDGVVVVLDPDRQLFVVASGLYEIANIPAAAF